MISNKLKGKIFYLSSGHGGPDPGATTRRAGRTICEDEYAYDVALRLCRLLVSHGATAYMIVRDPNDGIRSEELLKCDQDEIVWGGEDLLLGCCGIPRSAYATRVQAHFCFYRIGKY
ncbi:MAG: N-acetylmuramoyl-L-alanine amidase [Saprospiraceae bacterium]|nr:N-acetylmuramoyl-L-alanine amidase [Saprospiraceae bacterium]